MNGFYPNGRAARIWPLTAEDWISRLSPLCALRRTEEGLEHTLMRSIRIQAHAHFNKLELQRVQAT